jgi:hypothetical protein
MTLPITVTSISSRLDLLTQTLKCLLNQTLLPSGIWVWLSYEAHGIDEGVQELPKELEELVRREPLVHICWTENIGPYTKLLPFAKTFPDTPVLVVDDDTKYLPDLVENAWKAWKAEGGTSAICFRGTVMDVERPYRKWMDAKGVRGVGVFSKGNGGVVVHTSWFQNPRIHDSGVFLQLAPGADDIWFNLWRMWARIPCRCLEVPSFAPFSHGRPCLFQTNESKNDEHLKRVREYLAGLEAP